MSNSGGDHNDAKRTAEGVLRRDRGRIRQLAAVTIGLWIIASLMIPSVYLPIGAKLKHFATMLQAGAPPGFRIDPQGELPPAPVPTAQQVPVVLGEVQRQQWIIGQIILHEWIVGAIILGLALGAGILASVSTVALALTIRRVTLRQVSEQLAAISEQLRQMQRGSP